MARLPIGRILCYIETMAIPTNLKKQLETIKTRVTNAEKVAEKQIRSALKTTEKFRDDQMKNVQNLIKKARTMKQAEFVEAAERLRSEIEERATAGFDLLIGKLNLPNKKEVDRLNKRISALQKRVEELETNKAEAKSTEE